jgi:hypothetical protein
MPGKFRQSASGMLPTQTRLASQHAPVGAQPSPIELTVSDVQHQPDPIVSATTLPLYATL